MYKNKLNLIYTIIICVIAGMLLLGLWKEHSVIMEAGLLQGQGTQTNPYRICSDEEFRCFADAVNSGETFDGKYLSLESDIDFSKYGKMIGEYGSLDCTFSGFLNGNGYHIKNVNIEETEDGKAAGLFVNLSGTVCNLVIENGTITGPYAGAIAGSTYGKAKIYNCLNMALINGETVGRMAGEFFGNIENCISLDPNEDSSEGIARIVYSAYHNGERDNRRQEFYKEQCEEDVQKLNDDLNRLSVKEHFTDWCTWEVADDTGIMLTQNKAKVLTRMQTKINLEGNELTLEAYYGQDDMWYLAFPSGYQKKDVNVELLFSDGSRQALQMNSGIEEVAFWTNGNEPTVIWEKEEMTVGDDEREMIEPAVEQLKQFDPFTMVFLLRTVTSENIPTIMISSDGDRDLQYLNDMKIHEVQGNIFVLDEKGAVNYKGIMNSFTGRGNDSYAATDKIGFNLTLQNRVNLLDMGSNEDYVLLSGYRESSLLTYKITQDMEKEIGVANAPENRFVNVYVNNQYMGMYLLTEKVEIDENRIDISDIAVKTQHATLDRLSSYKIEEWSNQNGHAEKHWYDIPHEPLDVTGGYLLEVDKMDYTPDQSRFKSDNNITLVSKGAKYLSKGEIEYISDYWQQFEDALLSSDGYNDKGYYYADYIDLDSFVDQWLFYEMNGEISITGSVYYYKESNIDGDGLLHASYIWDVEHSFISEPEELNLLEERASTMSGYWAAFYRYNDFSSLVHTSWNDRFVPAVNRVLSDEVLDNTHGGVGSMHWYEQQYEQSACVNQTRWPDCKWDEKADEISEFLRLKSAYLTERF